MLVEQLADPLFVHRVGDRPQQRHGDRLDVVLAQLGEDVLDLLGVERLEHLALRGDPLAHLEGQLPRHVRVRISMTEVERA